jgi:CHASE2 domain-containing sensor protein
MKNNKFIQFSFSFVAAFILIAIIFLFPNFSRICELKAYDLKMRLTAGLKARDRAIANRIKVINVTDSTIKQMGWPKKSDHARMIDILSQHKAALIAYDWIFHEPDEELTRAVKDSGRVLWPVLFDLSLNRGYATDRYSQDTVSILESFGISDAQLQPALWQTTSVSLSHPSILQQAKGMGHISARNEEGNPQNDGVYRKVALVVNFAGHTFPSLALRAACDYLRVPLKKVRILAPGCLSPNRHRSRHPYPHKRTWRDVGLLPRPLAGQLL